MPPPHAACQTGSAADSYLPPNYARRKPGDCPGPSLSYIKGWDAEVRNEDILVPFLHEINQTLRTFPWTRKIDRAFFRGSAYCQAYTPKNIKGVCSRSHFAQLSRLANNTLIEAGLVEGNVGQRALPSAAAACSRICRRPPQR